MSSVWPKAIGKLARRNTRLQSLQESDLRVTIMSTRRRDHFASAIGRAGEQLDNDAFDAYSRVEIQERLQMLEANWQNYQTEHLSLVGQDTVTPHQEEAHMQHFQRIENEYLRLRLICRKQIEVLHQAERDAQANQQQPLPAVNQQRQQIVVQTADALANIPNTWGQFSGDYAQWHSFRDRFKAAVHLNQNLPIAFKFQYLKAAVTGAAARVLGTWKLTDANYPRAWERLCEVYEDDYLAVQTLIRRLLSIPRMERPTNSGLRRIIDTVHECMTQLSGFVKTDGWGPIIVFMVVDRLDSTTHDAWEMHRANSRAEEQPADIQDVEMHLPGSVHVVDEAERVYVQIPTWTELEQFLERRARILIHSERRERTDTYESTSSRSRENSTNRSKPKLKSVVVPANQQQQQPNTANRTATGFPSCSYCQQDHPIYHCNDFKMIGLDAKLEHIENQGMCKRCLREQHPGRECKQKVCLKCPNNQYHNTLLCPTREAERQTANLVNAETQKDAEAFGGTKRKTTTNTKRTSSRGDGK